jgi:hypothetical protein
MSNFYPQAVQMPGPWQKQGYGDLRTRTLKGAVVHSMEGNWQSAIARLDSTAEVSWHFSITLDGIVLQHYPLSSICFHAGFYANCRWAGIECEGRAGEMLTPQQVKALVYLLIWMANEEGWPGFKLEHDTGTLHQHRWYCATACPSDRINFTEVIRMATDVQGQIAIINLADRWMAMIKLGQLQQVINEAKAMGVVAQ